ncbi:MAG: lysine-sensitive aspartokinase 3 [Acidobacteria bacterium]|nr:MAG: lysine-sensitive aspartokinase 3 [Acidobacteriota bacterium]
MIVMKFGGTSVGSADRIRGLVDQVEERLLQRPVVVVSALAGVTDLLIRGAGLARDRDPQLAPLVSRLADRHQDMIRELFGPGPFRDRLLRHVADLMTELGSLYAAVSAARELTPRNLDAIAGIGERLSFEIVAAALEAGDIATRAVDARRLIVTDESFGRAVPLMDATAQRVRELLRPLASQGVVPVIPGFIGATPEGVVTTLGRGGSDWSASIIGAALPAAAIEIWSDVDGIMTLDPKVAPGATLIPAIGFEEASELARFGAKVLHPATLQPAVQAGIAVWVLNSFNPAAPGTRIDVQPEDAASEPRGIALRKEVCLVLIAPPRRSGDGFRARVFDAFARHDTPVDLLASSEAWLSLTVSDATRLPDVVAELAAVGEVQVLQRMATVTVVGRGFARRPGAGKRMLASVDNLHVLMIAGGSSAESLSLVVPVEQVEEAARRLHREFFEQEAREDPQGEPPEACAVAAWGA